MQRADDTVYTSCLVEWALFIVEFVHRRVRQKNDNRRRKHSRLTERDDHTRSQNTPQSCRLLQLTLICPSRTYGETADRREATLLLLLASVCYVLDGSLALNSFSSDSRILTGTRYINEHRHGQAEFTYLSP